MRASPWSLLATGLVGMLLGSLTVAPPPHVHAQAQQLPSTLPGAWRYPHPDAHGLAIVRAAVEPAIRALPSMFQGLARERLAQRTRMATRIEIGNAHESVQVSSHGERDLSIDMPLGATPRTIRAPEGHEVQASHRLSGGWLEQVFTGPNGDLRILYSTEPDGRTLHVDTSITSERLAQPIRYRLDYVRVEP
ncbi:MAG: hypothetical protein K1X94_27445 [Sandaracinaceae bacterium]|nr:hypothetical protein [Sandaracinaceae bacterium]